VSVLFEINDVSFGYGERRILHGISLILESGTFVGIIGPNGCGKTTLLDLMIRHRKPDGGVIRFRGKALEEVPRRALAREAALVPQHFYIDFPFTVKEVVMMGRYPFMGRFDTPSQADEDQVREVMASTHTRRFENRLVTELSGGERQRVVFARALAQDPDVLLLDEATSNMDIYHTLRLMESAAQRVRHEKKTVIAVMQDVNLAAAFCDVLVFMKNGSLVAHGPIQETLDSKILEAVFDVASHVYFESFTQSMKVAFRQ